MSKQKPKTSTKPLAEEAISLKPWTRVEDIAQQLIESYGTSKNMPEAAQKFLNIWQLATRTAKEGNADMAMGAGFMAGLLFHKLEKLELKILMHNKAHGTAADAVARREKIRKAVNEYKSRGFSQSKAIKRVADQAAGRGEPRGWSERSIRRAMEK